MNDKLAVQKEAARVLKYHQDLVWPEVNNYLRNPVFPSLFRVKSVHKQIEDFHWKMTRDYPERRGKYLRPTLIMLTAKAMGQMEKMALRLAVAMQISEEWILIHDDLEDKSVMRRGKPTLNELYGLELANNAGDTLHVIMWKALFDNLPILGKDKTIEIIDEFYRMLMRTTIGQTADLKWHHDYETRMKDEDWFFIADGVSSYYTVTGPIRMGGMLADANSEQLSVLTKFGLNLGRCFQLVDDLLDVTSDFGGLKQQGNDVFESKRTLILSHLLRNASNTDKKKIQKILIKTRVEKSNREVDWIINKMNDYESIDYVRRLATNYKKKALNIFDDELDFLNKQTAKDDLRILVDFILERDR